MQADPIIDQIREARHRISEEFGHDPTKLVEHYRKLEREEYADRLAGAPRSAPGGEQDSS
jgi:hypothetical protein